MVSYHPMLPNIAEILHRLHPVLQSSRRCKEVILGVPIVAFRRPKSGLIKGCVKCRDGRCKICKSMVEGEYFTSRVTGKSYVLNFRMDCNSDHVVYLLSCARCCKQYVGSTITKFRTRFKNHKLRLIAHQRLRWLKTGPSTFQDVDFNKS